MTADDINEFMTQLGPLDDAVLVVLRNSPAEWLLRYADADVEVTLVEGEGRLVFAALCGVPPVNRAAAVHALLLHFNAAWRDTGSIRMALAGADGEALLIVDVPAAQADPQHIGLIAANVANRAAAWRYIVEAGAPDDTPPVADRFDHAFIRA